MCEVLVHARYCKLSAEGRQLPDTGEDSRLHCMKLYQELFMLRSFVEPQELRLARRVLYKGHVPDFPW